MDSDEINSGAYQIFIYISKNIKLKIGKLGSFEFPKGNYVYTGSAMKNLKQRVARHKSKSKTLKWHIDYLLDNKFVKIKDIKLFFSTQKKECELNQILLVDPNAFVPVKKFGSSDCRNCPAHLVGFIN